MFGREWTDVLVKVQVHTVPVDLCNEALEFNIFDQPTTDDETTTTTRNSSSSNNNHSLALFFDTQDHLNEFFERPCEDYQMAQVASKLYPSAEYLLVSDDDLRAMGKYSGSPDTTLALATITFEDGEAIKNNFGMDRSNTTSTLVVQIDAISRSLLDVCIDSSCFDYDSGVETLWIMRFTSVLSLIGSCYIIYGLIGRNKQSRTKNMRKLFNRLLLGVCIGDVMSSLAMVLGTLPMPSTPPGNFQGYHSQARWDEKYAGAVGNTATCSAQGFFMQLGLSVSTNFTAFISIQTLLMVRYRWTELKMRKLGMVLFTIGIGMPLVLAIWAAAADLMNPFFGIKVCWINVAPDECGYEYGGPFLDEYCDDVARGQDFFIYQIAFAMVWVVVTLFVITGSMVSLFVFVRKRERRAARWSTTAQGGHQQKKVLTKGLLYISVYLVVWVPSSIGLLMSFIVDPALLSPIVATFLPLQGFLNSLIYAGAAEKCLQRVFCPESEGGRNAARASTRQTTFFGMNSSKESNSTNTAGGWSSSFRLKKPDSLRFGKRQSSSKHLSQDFPSSSGFTPDFSSSARSNEGEATPFGMKSSKDLSKNGSPVLDSSRRLSSSFRVNPLGEVIEEQTEREGDDVIATNVPERLTTGTELP